MVCALLWYHFPHVVTNSLVRDGLTQFFQDGETNAKPKGPLLVEESLVQTPVILYLFSGEGWQSGLNARKFNN